MSGGDPGGTTLGGDGVGLGGDGGAIDVAVDERALASFVEVSERLGRDLDGRLAEAQDLDRWVRNASPDGAVPSGVLGELDGLAGRWRAAASMVDSIRSGAMDADQGWAPTALPGGAGAGRWGRPPLGARSPMTLGDDEPGGVEILPPSPELGIGVEILPPSPELGIGVEILPPSPELGIGVETLPPAPDLGSDIEIFPVDDDERILREFASRKRRKPPPAGDPVPTGPVFRPDDPFAPVPVHGKLYPAHQVTFWPTGRTAPGPDGRPQPLYDTKLLGEGALHVDNNTLIDTTGKRTWHLDVENPNPGQRPGQLHLQYKVKGVTYRHVYDFTTDQFLPSKDGVELPRWLEKEVRSDPQYERSLQRARKTLQVPSVPEAKP